MSPICLIIPDLISGGQRSTIPRYLIPAYLGIQLSMAYLLATKLTKFTNKIEHKFWQIATVLLISLGIISCGISSQAETWWNKYSSYYDGEVARIIMFVVFYSIMFVHLTCLKSTLTKRISNVTRIANANRYVVSHPALGIYSTQSRTGVLAVAGDTS